MMIDKETLRKQFRSNLATLSDIQRIVMMQEMTKLVTAHPRWQTAQTVAVTLSQDEELPTQLLIHTALIQGKRVVVPKVAPKRQMDFYQVTTSTEYARHRFGMLEPIDAPIVMPNEIDLLIVPGLGYDEAQQRIGFGGGYYDRYLPRTTGYKLALAIEQNIVPAGTWAVEETDVAMDEVIVIRGPREQTS